MTYRYTFTVFTPTYNRAHTLHAVYESLQAQTFRDFEWLIVDDGSSDGTADLVEGWRNEADFPIRYYWQENRGKHRAYNRAVAMAEGELLFTWDSDDVCLPHTLERMYTQWQSIPEARRHEFAGVAGLCATQNGAVIGSPYPADVFDSDMFEIREKYAVTGDKCGFQKTDVMKAFPFPEIEGERFLTESVVFYRIAKHYKTRFFNEVLRVREYRADGLSAAGVRLIVDNPKGYMLALNEYLARSTRMSRSLRAAAFYVRHSLHAGTGLRSALGSCERPLLAASTIPLGVLLYLRDRYRGARRGGED